MHLINLTPHALSISVEPGDTLELPSQGVARLEENSVDLPDISADEFGLTLFVKHQRTQFGDIVGLPEPRPDVIYVCSMPVAQEAARRGRRDVVSPGPLLRDGEGAIVGCTGLRSWGR